MYVSRTRPFTTEVVFPDMVEELGAGQHPPRVQHQVAQQLELGRRQLDRVAGHCDQVRGVVEFDVVEDEPLTVGVGMAGAAQDVPDPRDELPRH